MKKVLAIGLLGLAACGGTTTERVVYVPESTTTTKAPPTTEDTPIAVSPTEEFIGDIYSVYYGPVINSDSELIEAGWTTCEFLQSGGSITDVIYSINQASNDTDMQEYIGAVVASAITNFCPDQSYKLNN